MASNITSLNSNLYSEPIESNVLKNNVDSMNNQFKEKEKKIESVNKQLSYLSIIQDIQRFRGSAKAAGSEFDFPNRTYFKVLFHFGDNSDNTEGSGLLHPTWAALSGSSKNTVASIEQLWQYNTAWSYLVINNEVQRAKNLQKFIEMLSDINSNTPWYFQTITGLDRATERKFVPSLGKTDAGTAILEDQQRSIEIECIEDSYDLRIGTLMDLYRSIVFSWETKRSIVPLNLRKFDMTIIAFQIPITGYQTGPMPTMKDASVRNTIKSIAETTDGFALIYDNPKGSGSTTKVASYKAWEFHGCEFDYNSIADSKYYGTISNKEGSVLMPVIKIGFDDAYEIRWSDRYPSSHISDLMGDHNISAPDNNTLENQATNWSQSDGTGWFGQIFNQEIKKPLIGNVKSVYIGNINGYSIDRFNKDINNLDNFYSTFGAFKKNTGLSNNYNGYKGKPIKKSIYYDNNNADPLSELRQSGRNNTSRTMI